MFWFTFLRFSVSLSRVHGILGVYLPNMSYHCVMYSIGVFQRLRVVGINQGCLPYVGLYKKERKENTSQQGTNSNG